MNESSPACLESLTKEESSFSSWAYKHFQREFVAGGFAGSVGIFVGFPFDLIKVRLQSHPELYESKALQCLKITIRKDGIAGLYKGCLPPICSQAFINAFLFVGESTAMKFLQPNLRPGEVGTPLSQFVAGCCGGFVSCSILVPSDVIKCTLQANDVSNGKPNLSNNFVQTLGTIRHIYANEGLAGFFKGFWVTCARDVPSLGLYFLTYKSMRSLLDSYRILSHDLSIAIAGGFAGAVSWAAVYPLDVIKTNIQIAPMEGKARWTTISMGRVLFAKYGAVVFFRGIGITMARAFPVNGATFYVYELLKRAMHV